MRLFICILFAVAAAFAAYAEERYALLIGNEDYPATVGPLSLPHEDVENIRSGLIQARFPAGNIRILKDATQGEINLAVAQLATDLRTAGPEAIGFDLPEIDVSYRVAVHAWQDHGFGPSIATVRVYLLGDQIFESQPVVLNTLDLWEVADITWQGWPNAIVTPIAAPLGGAVVYPNAGP
mgnify:CR=1 FL=1